MSDMGEEFIIDVALGFGRLRFNDGGLRNNLRNGPRKTMDAAWITAQREAPRVENYMRQNAPWTDRTGNARSGLHATPFRDGNTVGIDLYGSVPYQIYLETRFSGQYAIIVPTIDVMGPVVMASFNRLLDRI